MWSPAGLAGPGEDLRAARLYPAHRIASVGEHVGSRLDDVPPARFVATYLAAWVDYFRSYRREMMAIAELWTSFRDAEGRPHLDARTLGSERELVEAALTAGQAEGTLGDFSPRVMAVTLKAARP